MIPTFTRPLQNGTINSIIVLILLVTGISLYPQLTKAEALIIPGTGACENILKKIASSFNKQNTLHRVEIPPSVGSSGGISALMNGKSIVARVARRLKESERAEGISYLVFAKDSIVFATGSKVDIQSLTISQLENIFSGKISNWQQVEAEKATIRVIIREPGDSSLTIIQEHIQPFVSLQFTPKAKVVFHEYEMVDALLKYKRAIGWLANSSIPNDDQVHRLGIDNIMPTPDNILSGKYPLVGEYALAYKKDELTDLARSFIDYLFSDEVKQQLLQNGLVPVERN